MSRRRRCKRAGASTTWPRPRKILVCGYHFPFPGLGYIEKAGTGYRLVPAAWSPVL
jgi:hypothetical protein